MYKNTNKTISIKNYEHHLKNLLRYVEKDKTDYQLTRKSKLKCACSMKIFFICLNSNFTVT